VADREVKEAQTPRRTLMAILVVVEEAEAEDDAADQEEVTEGKDAGTQAGIKTAEGPKHPQPNRQIDEPNHPTASLPVGAPPVIA
jgi:hypothetical protein